MKRCTHTPTCRVSSHADLMAAMKDPNEPVASVHCCDREPCRAWATFEVQGQTGKPAVAYRFDGSVSDRIQVAQS